MQQPLAGTGVWAASLRYGEGAAEQAAELERLGYSAAWIPDVGGDVFAAVEGLLAGTTSLVIATGILNLWMHTAEETAAQHARMVDAHGDRFLVGIGISHAPLIDMKEPGTYRKPLENTAAYLDGLDAAPTPLAASDRMLAALGPRMLDLAGQRTAGAHPYLVTPEHTDFARSRLGSGPTIAVEQGVVLETDPATAREIARANLAGYMGLPNYTNNWKRFGFTDEDIEGGGSDRLVDALVAWGDEATIATRVQAHRDAGANHVCIQVLQADRGAHATEAWRTLAPALL